MRKVITPEELRAFEKEVADFHAKSEAEIGEIVRCHLIVEYYLNKCLEVCYPELRKNEEIRLSFHQKINLIPSWCFGFPWIRDGVVHLNRIRNKAAHNIHYKLNASDLGTISAAVAPLQSLTGKKFKGMEFVKELSRQASMALFANATRLSKASKYGLGAFRLLEEQGYWDEPEE